MHCINPFKERTIKGHIRFSNIVFIISARESIIPFGVDADGQVRQDSGGAIPAVGGTAGADPTAVPTANPSELPTTDHENKLETVGNLEYLQ